MKTKQLFWAVWLSGLIFVCSTLSAQSIEINEQPITYKKTAYQALNMELPPGDAKTIEDHWETFLESRYNVRVKGNGFLFGKNTLQVEDALIKDIAQRNMDLYARVTDKNKQPKLQVFGSFGEGIPIDPYQFPVEYKRTEQLMKDFYTWHNNSLYQQKIDLVRADMNDLNESQTDLLDEKSKLQTALNNTRERLQQLENQARDLESQLQDTGAELQRLDQQERAQELYLNTLKANLMSQN